MKHVVKRRGHQEKFDERKVYASCYASFLAAQINQQKSEKLCEGIAKKVKIWIKSKHMVTSEQIFKLVLHEMKKINKNAALMYESHRDIS